MDVPDCVYRISVKAIIKNDDGQLMMIREDDGLWEFPGGGLDHGEDPKTGLAREIKEEIGCNLDHISEAPVAFWTIHKDVFVKWFAFVAYEAKISGEHIKSNEAEEIGWFTFEEAKKLPLHDNTRPYFLD